MTLGLPDPDDRVFRRGVEIAVHYACGCCRQTWFRMTDKARLQVSIMKAARGKCDDCKLEYQRHKEMVKRDGESDDARAERRQQALCDRALWME